MEKSIEWHLKKIKSIQRKARIQKMINNTKCFLGFHSDYYKDINGGIFSDNKCSNCGKYTNKL